MRDSAAFVLENQQILRVIAQEMAWYVESSRSLGDCIAPLPRKASLYIDEQHSGREF